MPNAYDIYIYDRYLGTVGLVNGKLEWIGNEEGVKQQLDLVREMSGKSADAEVFAEIPKVLTGTVHVRENGDVVGITVPSKI